MLHDSDNDDDVDLDLRCDRSDSSNSDDAFEQDVELAMIWTWMMWYSRLL